MYQGTTADIRLLVSGENHEYNSHTFGLLFSVAVTTVWAYEAMARAFLKYEIQ
jgi:hypothetical protein